MKSLFGKKKRPGFFLLVLLLSACRAHSDTTAHASASPMPSAAPMFAFAVPVGLLPVNVVGSYGGGTNFARHIGAGKHPIPSGLGVPESSASAKQSTWACWVLLYGDGAGVQYEGMGQCGIGQR